MWAMKQSANRTHSYSQAGSMVTHCRNFPCLLHFANDFRPPQPGAALSCNVSLRNVAGEAPLFSEVRALGRRVSAFSLHLLACALHGGKMWKHGQAVPRSRLRRRQCQGSGEGHLNPGVSTKCEGIPSG